MDYARIKAVAEELLAHAPDPGLGAEISGGMLFMMTSPSGTHELVALRLRRQFDKQLPDGLVAHTGGDVEDPAHGILRRPDLIVLPEEAMDTAGAFHPSDVALVAEVVSPSNHINDYDRRAHDYPAMGIPFYLLVDPRKGTVTVFSDPHGTDTEGRPSYRVRADYAFGDTVPVGEWTLDTSELPLYRT